MLRLLLALFIASLALSVRAGKPDVPPAGHDLLKTVPLARKLFEEYDLASAPAQELKSLADRLSGRLVVDDATSLLGEPESLNDALLFAIVAEQLETREPGSAEARLRCARAMYLLHEAGSQFEASPALGLKLEEAMQEAADPDRKERWQELAKAAGELAHAGRFLFPNALHRALLSGDHLRTLHTWRGHWLLREGRPLEAMEAFRDSVDQGGGLYAGLGIHQALLDAGYRAEARKVRRSLLRLAPGLLRRLERAEGPTTRAPPWAAVNASLESGQLHQLAKLLQGPSARHFPGDTLLAAQIAQEASLLMGDRVDRSQRGAAKAGLMKRLERYARGHKARQRVAASIALLLDAQEVRRGAGGVKTSKKSARRFEGAAELELKIGALWGRGKHGEALRLARRSLARGGSKSVRRLVGRLEVARGIDRRNVATLKRGLRRLGAKADDTEAGADTRLTRIVGRVAIELLETGGLRDETRRSASRELEAFAFRFDSGSREGAVYDQAAMSSLGALSNELGQWARKRAYLARQEEALGWLNLGQARMFDEDYGAAGRHFTMGLRRTRHEGVRFALLKWLALSRKKRGQRNRRELKELVSLFRTAAVPRQVTQTQPLALASHEFQVRLRLDERGELRVDVSLMPRVFLVSDFPHEPSFFVPKTGGGDLARTPVKSWPEGSQR